MGHQGATRKNVQNKNNGLYDIVFGVDCFYVRESNEVVLNSRVFIVLISNFF